MVYLIKLFKQENEERFAHKNHNLKIKFID